MSNTSDIRRRRKEKLYHHQDQSCAPIEDVVVSTGKRAWTLSLIVKQLLIIILINSLLTTLEKIIVSCVIGIQLVRLVHVPTRHLQGVGQVETSRGAQVWYLPACSLPKEVAFKLHLLLSILHCRWMPESKTNEMATFWVNNYRSFFSQLVHANVKMQEVTVATCSGLCYIFQWMASPKPR